jgi:hypothetical protein
MDDLGDVQLLAVGDSQGRLHILEVPRNLAHKVQKEVLQCHSSDKVLISLEIVTAKLFHKRRAPLCS